MPSLIITDWMTQAHPVAGMSELTVLREKAGARAVVTDAIDTTVKDHLVGLDILDRIGTYKRALAHIRNKLPTNKQVRSGDLAEIFVSEYVDQCTEYDVPIKKLRWKDDRTVAMRGNDVIASRKHKSRWFLLKGESKSRASLRDDAVEEAVGGLRKHSGRPNPCTLAFISSRLREMDRDAEAGVFEDLQSRPLRHDEIEHLIFTLSGNDPTTYLSKHPTASARVRCHLVGCVIPDHQQFIESVFKRLYAGKPK